MTIGILKETRKGEKRVAMSPGIVKQLIEQGFNVIVEKDAGVTSTFKNSDFKKAGAEVEIKGVVFKNADVVIKINPFDEEDLKLVKKGQVLISQLFHKSNPD